MDIGAWLRGLGLERYEQVFRDAALDASLLPELTDAHLKELGIPLGHRLQLAKAVAALGVPPDPATDATGPRAEAERRQLTVMFCDLVGSTALSARLDPEDMREVIRRYQDTCAGIITRYEGFVAKFMGDGVLAYFGYPRAHEDEAERAVRAGIALVEAIAKLRVSTEEGLAARVGIATGLVVVGDLVGEGSAQEQAVVGEPPNLAARLQVLARPGQVVIAESTRRLLGDSFALGDLGPQALKGLAEPVTAFAVTAERAVASRFEAQRGQLTPMVGRDQELALLLERWAQAKAGEGQGVVLVGEAGIGKSRIAQALLDALASEPHALIRYQCSPYHTDSALWPVIQQLGHAAGFATTDTTETRLDRLETLLDRTGQRAAARLIAGLVGLDGTARYGEVDLTPQAQRTRTLDALVQQMLVLGAQRPLLALLEDAHWIDPTTLELIEQGLDRIAAAPVLMLLTSRPDNQPALAAHPHLTRLSLNRLGRAGAEAIIDRLRGDTAIPHEVIAAVIARTDGVPLFVEELTKAVLGTDETDIPASLHDSLMARLDRIPDAKDVAQTAACIGREFAYPLLAAVVGKSDPGLQASLEKLAGAELIFRHGAPPDVRYTFKHALVRDAAYQSLLKSRRRVLHGRILEALEREATPSPELLAAHATAADRIEPAIGYWERAGQAAHQRAAYKESLAHFRTALGLVAKLPHASSRPRIEARLLIGIGVPTGTLAGFGTKEAEDIYQRAFEVCDPQANPGLAAAALDGLWRVQHDRGDEQAAKNVAEEELTHAERDGSPAASQAAYSNLGTSAVMLGDFTGAMSALRRVSGGEMPHPDGRAGLSGRNPRIYASSMEALALWQLGMPDRALSTVEAGAARGSQSRRVFDQVMPLSFVAKVRLLRREYDEARRHAEHAVNLAEERGVPHFLNDALIWLGAALAELGEVDQGLDSICRGINGRRSRGSLVAMPLFLLIHASALSRAGRWDEALAILDDAIELSRRYGDTHWLAETHRVRAITGLAHKRHDIDPAAELLHALEVARAQDAKSQELRAAASLARLWAEQGERSKALDVLLPVYTWFTEGFGTPDLRDAKRLLDQLA